MDLKCQFQSKQAEEMKILSKCKYLRALSFHKVDVLPSSIGKLIHLRHLDLSYCSIKTLPESLCNLRNLQTLKLFGCYELTMLPGGLHNLVSLRHLDIRGTYLEEMPKKMNKLIHLDVLSYFVVGKHKNNGIRELGGISNLHGSFELKKLENVVDAKEAKSARMIDKKHIEGILLEWSSGDEIVSNKQTEREILDSLQPHHGLKELTIKGYRGTIFPDWVGHSSYQNMTNVSLQSCKNCCMLPALGQLPSLKVLRIEGFDQLKSIGMEFYKNEGDQQSSPIALFPSLERLVFRHMPCWQVWQLPESETFPQLKVLEIVNCPMLQRNILSDVFWRIISSLLSDVSKVRKLHVSRDRGRSETMHLDEDTLSIKACEWVIDSVFRAIGIHQQQKYDLVELQIGKNCGSLTALSLDAFPNLKNLGIHRSGNLESISMSEPPHASLQHLSISECPEFESFPAEGLAAPNLTDLDVIRCSKLVALPRGMNTLLPNLQSLRIQDCPKISWFPECGLPPNLKELTVGRQWRDLLPTGNLDALTHLTIIDDCGCQSMIKSFPEVGSLPHLPSLTTLNICRFYNLATLECNELLRLTSLQQLDIRMCPNLENMEGEKLPPSLLLLKVYDCDLLGEHCKNKHQLISPKISHIPTIQVDCKKIV
ncbi:putative disease resistance RPP13-like protein 1 [Arachis hypogaea]|uniref:putative disease resistance RPP13-like protein 1 n=1 Tax=Arachis hypogaea TaxID=3818 RepID=UPI000DED363A|nr:putative disease resistance protein At3g14460 [Arachis hypogaea]QHO22299.1 Putative disease resistance RPP13-like protein [Arachis hypogaea]